MRYKEFGKTGMKVSEMALGTWGIGGAGWDDNPEEIRIDAICTAVENGVNFIDTAPAYNAGGEGSQAERNAPKGHSGNKVRKFLHGKWDVCS